MNKLSNMTTYIDNARSINKAYYNTLCFISRACLHCHWPYVVLDEDAIQPKSCCQQVFCIPSNTPTSDNVVIIIVTIRSGARPSHLCANCHLACRFSLNDPSQFVGECRSVQTCVQCPVKFTKQHVTPISRLVISY